MGNTPKGKNSKKLLSNVPKALRYKLQCSSLGVNKEVKFDTWSLVELNDPINYKKKAFWPLYLSNSIRKVIDSRKGSPTKGKEIAEGRPFHVVDDPCTFHRLGQCECGQTGMDQLPQVYIRMNNIISSSDPECKEALQNNFIIVESGNQADYFCAKFDESETSAQNALCRGDIGGPLICETETGMERLCGLLSTVNITGSVTHDTGTCQLGMSVYPFRNLTTEGSIRFIHSEIRRKENKYGLIYREPAAGGKGKPIHDDNDEDETKSFVFQRTFNDVWNSAGQKG